MHICPQEVMALLAVVPTVAFLITWLRCRLGVGRRHEHTHCEEDATCER